MDDLFELLKYMVILAVALIIMGITVIYPMSSYNCHTKGDLYGIEVNHNFSGCYVKTEHSVVPMRLYEKSVMEITNINMMGK